METLTAGEDASCDHSHSKDAPLAEARPYQDDQKVLSEKRVGSHKHVYRYRWANSTTTQLLALTAEIS